MRTGTTPVRRIAVVVPARDEAASIGRCLAALDRARSLCTATVDLVVVADVCQDETAELAGAAGARVVVSRAGCVGAARALGVRTALAAVPAAELASTWIASTDADSVVPRPWLAHHLRSAAAGADLLLGTVRLAGPRTRHAQWRARYAAATGPTGHRHVHGANLGVRASTYLAAGGFPPVPAHEDRLLAERVRELPGACVLSSPAHPVLTSDRLLGRAPEGVAHDLSA